MTMVGAGCGGAEQVCYVASQLELNEKIVDEHCLLLWAYEFSDETLEASSERTDIELSVINAGVESPALKHVVLDHVKSGSIANLESITVTRYQGGMVSAGLLDLTFGESPIIATNLEGSEAEVGGTIAFQAREAGSVRLRATGTMDGWRFMSIGALPSWQGVVVEVDPAAQPTTELYVAEQEGLALEQLHQFGAKLQAIYAGRMPTALLEPYAGWLESQGFAGTLFHTVADDERVTFLPRPANP